MAKIYGQLEFAQAHNRTNANRGAAASAGRLIWNTDSAELQVDNGTSWESLATGTANVLETTDLSAETLSVAVGSTRFHPYLTIDTGFTWTINGQLVSAGTMTVDGTLTVASGGTVLVLN